MLFNMFTYTVTLFVFLWTTAVVGTRMIYNDSLPTNLTSACSAALLTDIACDPLVANLRPDFFYPPESLKRICTQPCSSALATWMTSVNNACNNQTVVIDSEVQAAAAVIPGSLDYILKFSCLQESGNYCGPVAALAAAFDDPGVSVFNYIDQVPSGAVRPSKCDACLAARLRFRAGSPYFDGPIVASEYQYQIMTQSCSITGKPVTTTTIGYFTAQPPQPTAPVCDGTQYTIKSSDNCNTIAKSQGVGTAWLLADNNLQAYCTNFPTSGTLCITNKCNTVTVGANTTCSAIARAANITETQFRAWNPIINMACSNLPSMNGTQVCIDAPGRKFVPPNNVTMPGTTPTVPAPLPTNTAEGSNKTCGQWYQVQKGDFCNALILKFAIPLADFLFLNPGVNSNCTNLFADESYCVKAVGDINTYSGRPGYMPITINPNATFTGTPFTRLPNGTLTAYSRYTPLPTAVGTRDDCVHYFDGDQYQIAVNGTSWKSSCAVAAYVFGIQLSDLGVWNPGLGDVNATTCAFQKGVRYCGSWYVQTESDLTSVSPTSTTATGGGTTSPTPPAPTLTGQPQNCNKWAVVKSGDTCDTLASAAGISRAQFLTYNPAVSSDCSQNFWTGYAYCVGVAGGTTTGSTTTTKPASPTPPAPTLTGQPSNCNKWSVVKSGDNCDTLASAAGISRAQFLTYNPAVSSDCSQNFWVGYAYCVGVSGGSTPTTTTRPATTTTKPPSSTPSSSKPPADKIQPGQPSNCSKWDKAVSGDDCSKLASRNRLTLAQLATLNPALGQNGKDCGTKLWLDYYYCTATL